MDAGDKVAPKGHLIGCRELTQQRTEIRVILFAVLHLSALMSEVEGDFAWKPSAGWFQRTGITLTVPNH